MGSMACRLRGADGRLMSKISPVHHVSTPEPTQPQPSRRRFFQISAGALGLALFAKPASAAPAAVKQPAPESRLARSPRERSPGPDWERVEPSPPQGIGGWRNTKDHRFWTDWIPREREEWVLNPNVLPDGDRQVALSTSERWHSVGHGSMMCTLRSRARETPGPHTRNRLDRGTSRSKLTLPSSESR